MPTLGVRELRITEEVRPLLAQLEEAKSLAAKFTKNKSDAPSTSSSSSVVNQLIKDINDINGEIHFITRIFSQLEVWERDMMGKIGDIAKELNKALEDGNIDENDFQSKIRSTKKEASGFNKTLRASNCPLRLDQLEAYAASVPHAAPSPDLSHRPSTSMDMPVSEQFQFDTTISEAEMSKSIRLLDPFYKLILVFLCIFPVGSLIKRRIIHHYCWHPNRRDHVAMMFFQDPRVRSGLLDKFFKLILLFLCSLPLGLIKSWTMCYKSWGAKDWDSLNEELRFLDYARLIKCIYKDCKPQEVDSCVINPSVHKAVINLVHHDESFRDLARRIRDPLSIHPILLSEPAHVTLESYVNVNHKYLKFEKNKFLEMKNAGVLSLGRLHGSAKHHIEVESIEFLKWLGSFWNLKVLSLRGISRITELPPTIGALKGLCVLDLRECYDLQKLPVELTSLEFLQHLDTIGCHFLSDMPKGIGSLRRLQTLQGFVVGNSQGHEACQLGELSGLRELVKLSIDIGRDSVLEDEEFNELSRLTSLESLTITWSGSKSSSLSNRNGSASSRVLTVSEMDVSPPPNLRKLDLRCFPQSTRPRWLDPIKLVRLEKLYIRGGNLKLSNLCEENMQWPYVKVLRLRFLQGVDMKVKELPAFPNLRYLEIHDCNDYITGQGGKFQTLVISPPDNEFSTGGPTGGQKRKGFLRGRKEEDSLKTSDDYLDRLEKEERS